MSSVAVVAHSRKTLGGGLSELRDVLARNGIDQPQWFEVMKSKKAPKWAKRAVEHGADLVFVWGGDGMVQRCINVLAGTGVTIAIIPAGTANLLANNLGIPIDLAAAVDIGLHGDRRHLDVGKVNGERFAVMAGTGFDARMIGEADAGLKDKVGRLAYVWTGAKATGAERARASVRVDGNEWFKGSASCVLLGNVGTLMGGLQAFDDAKPDDGVLEVGVVTAKGRAQWLRVVSRLTVGSAEKSPLVHTTHGKKVDVELDRKLPYELDGGARKAVKRLKVRIEPGAITVCVPAVAA